MDVGEKADVATLNGQIKVLPSFPHEPGDPTIGVRCINNEYAIGLQDTVAFHQQVERVIDVLDNLE
jgi:hypothetical protein